MLCSEIIKILERQSPPEYALGWDNVGLLVGRYSKEVKKLAIALDATNTVIEKAIEQNVDMIITHHPVIFSKIGRINDETVLGRKILSMIENNICCYAMHTNFDTKGGMAKLAANMLNLKNQMVLEESNMGEGIGRIGILGETISLCKLADLVKSKFELSNVIVFGDNETHIEKVAISPGSGKSVIEVAIKSGAQCLVTGDIGHHEGLDAVEAGLTIIDASHYGLEKIFMQFMASYLADFCRDVEIGIIDQGETFTVI